ncbi:peptidoglycan DD-metalloendopeptidase family protein [Luteimonas viscosa]|uniref:Peptidoglycan DD-metalloendopeptidase family protein n=1 Tax=Luteimonas viscosa TaxID=1132694 RepID=A0A5D4XPW0_9GAMM|nr:peptidoglycan DD-metalloendopeptidase family protein [Luteimonas viscosa]TYT26686.1 peptidoglycan DD-metalloendopeptidase family protein [Luteimonas viscosa]
MSEAVRARLAWAAFALLAAGFATAPVANAQQAGREAERRLERVRKELQDVASERRRLEGQCGAAARQLRSADEQVARTARTLQQIEAELAAQQAALQELADRRDALRERMGAQREELDALLRASHVAGRAAPLKLMLAQDQVADASRALTYHRYLQRQRAARIAALRGELAELDALERDMVQRRAALERAHEQQRSQVDALERDRAARAKAVAQLDSRYRDRSTREKALGRDARALERLLARLRAAAAKAEAERKAAAARAAQRAASGEPARKPPPAVARAAPIQVGGLGWPLSGALLAGYGGRMPDGRSSSGVLIGAAAGTPVRAVADGTVVFAEWMTGYGMILIVDHGNGAMSLYAHCETLLKEPGTTVKRGDAVATVGNSGGQGRPALYFELRRNGQPVNPDTFLQKR